MARTEERLDAVMEEALDAEFEEIMETAQERRGRCVGESFPIFSDEEGGEDFDAEGPQFISRLTPLEQVGRGTSAGTPPITYIWQVISFASSGVHVDFQ